MRPSKVLLVVHGLPPFELSGTPLIAQQYGEELARRGVDVGIVYAVTESDAGPLGAHRIDGEAFWRFGTTATLWRWLDWCSRDVAGISGRDGAALRPFDDLLHRFRPDLVHVIDSVNLPSEWPLLARARGIPVVRSVWNTEDICGNGEPLVATEPPRLCPPPLRPADCASHYSFPLLDGHIVGGDELCALLKAKRRFTELLFDRVYDRVIFPTESFRDFFTATLPIGPERAVVIEPGIDTAWARSITHEDRPGERNLAFLGTFVPRKGVGLLRDAFLHPSLRARSDYVLSVYGNGDPAPILELQQHNPRVQYLGAYTPADLPSILATASVGLSPSWFETYHRVTREYLAAGVPVIGTTAFGIPDAVEHGVNGLLVEQGDVGGFVGAILRVLDDPTVLRALREGASRTRLRSVPEEVDDVVAVYCELLNEQG